MVPEKVWKVVLPAALIFLALLVLGWVVGIGTNVSVNLLPEGMLDDFSQVGSVSKGDLPEIISPFAVKWRISNREHRASITPSRDYNPVSGGNGETILYAPISGVVSVHPRDGIRGGLGYGGYGNYIEIEGEEYRVLMAHFADGKGGSSFAFVQNGDTVEVGTALGVMGTTGISSGPHLHLEIFKNGVRMNPEDLIPQYDEALASVYRGEGEGVLARAQVPQEKRPSLGRQFLQWLAGARRTIGEFPADVTGGETSWDATVGNLTVRVKDERVNKFDFRPWPDARKIVRQLVEKIPGLEGEFVVALVDEACLSAGCYPGMVVSDHRIELDPNHPQAEGDLDEILSRQLAVIADSLGVDAVFFGLTTDPADEEEPQPDELEVLVFTREGDAGTETLRPTIERLQFDYPWICFRFVDSLSPEGQELVRRYGVEGTPTTVLTRAGRLVWLWEGPVDGLEELLEVNRFLGETLMAQGKVPFLQGQGPAGKIPNVTFAGVYGALCATKGTLGLLGKGGSYLGAPAPACTAEGALEIAGRWGKWVEEHNGGKTVVNVLMPTVRESSAALISEIIAEAGRRNGQGEHWYVMLDLQSDAEFDAALGKWVTAANPHVGFILDVEWFGRKVAISSINALAEKYFSHRQKLGLKGLGIFGVWYFDPTTISADEKVTREWEKDTDLQSSYSTGIVVPIMDGQGSASAKLAKYDSMMKLFGASYGGMMGFTLRWNNIYDSASPEEIFREDMLFWTQQ